LTEKLHRLITERDWSKNQADIHWEDAKKYEAQGRIGQALEEKKSYER